MKANTLTLVAFLFVGLTAARCADEKDDNKTKILGVWEGKVGDSKGASVEFTKDGKIKILIDSEGKKRSLEGTYDLAGDVINLSLKGADGKERKEKMKIKTLTDTDLSWEDEKGRQDDFKKQEKK
jgi:uncharacterized protein (TIGR03066 family)